MLGSTERPRNQQGGQLPNLSFWGPPLALLLHQYLAFLSRIACCVHVDVDQDGSVKIFNLPNSLHSTICHRTLSQVPEDQSYWGLGFPRAEIATLIESSRDLSCLKFTLRL